eukprot:1561217-Pyramimonas_sp.AAC.1
MANARNQLVSSAGSLPQQWVLGAGHRLPASLANPNIDPAVVSRVSESASFWKRAANSSALRRTVLARARPQPGPFQRGDETDVLAIGQSE